MGFGEKSLLNFLLNMEKSAIDCILASKKKKKRFSGDKWNKATFSTLFDAGWRVARIIMKIW